MLFGIHVIFTFENDVHNVIQDAIGTVKEITVSESIPSWVNFQDILKLSH